MAETVSRHETTTADFEEGTLTYVAAVDDGLELDLPAWNEIFEAGQTWREVFE